MGRELFLLFRSSVLLLFLTWMGVFSDPPIPPCQHSQSSVSVKLLWACVNSPHSGLNCSSVGMPISWLGWGITQFLGLPLPMLANWLAGESPAPNSDDGNRHCARLTCERWIHCSYVNLMQHLPQPCMAPLCKGSCLMQAANLMLICQPCSAHACLWAANSQCPLANSPLAD